MKIEINNFIATSIIQDIMEHGIFTLPYFDNNVKKITIKIPETESLYNNKIETHKILSICQTTFSPYIDIQDLYIENSKNIWEIIKNWWGKKETGIITIFIICKYIL